MEDITLKIIQFSFFMFAIVLAIIACVIPIAGFIFLIKRIKETKNEWFGPQVEEQCLTKKQ